MSAIASTPAGTHAGPPAGGIRLALTDSATMLRRQLRRMIRYPSMTVQLVGMPIVFLLLFVYVFGATLGNGLGGASAAAGAVAGAARVGGRAAYVNYVVPGILMMTIAATITGTAISVAMDMTQGVVARFRTMAIARVCVLTGHVLGSLIQALLGVAVVLAVAVLIGFRADAGPVAWLGVLGLLALVAFALIWLAVGMGLASSTVEGASNLPMPLVFLPFLGSGFVPTDSLPTGLRWFAEYQPFTPVMEALRALLWNRPVGSNVVVSVAWFTGIALVGYLWSRRLYNREAA